MRRLEKNSHERNTDDMRDWYFIGFIALASALVTWLPLLGSFALLFLWVDDVAHGTGGGDNLRALFWDNLVGRFASYSNPSDAVRALGHPNWPGKYLVELPVYLLPWTPLLCGSIVCLWRDRQLRTPMTIPARFALCACIPALCILSIASTSRGIYAAPIIPGIALLVAIVMTRAEPDPGMHDVVRSAVRWTVWVLMVTDGLLIAAIGALDTAHGRGGQAGLVASLVGMVILVAICLGVLRDCGFSPERSAAVEFAVVRLAGAHAAALITIAVALFPVLNRSQDLARIAAVLEESSAGRPLVLWLPDETTLAMSDLYMRKPVCSILFDHGTEADRARLLSDCLKRFPRAAIVAVEACPKDECGDAFKLALRKDPMQRRHLAFHDATLLSAGLNPVDGIVRLGGRAYVVGYHVL